MTETAVEVKDATADKDAKEENNAKEQTAENDAGSGDATKTGENQTTEPPKAAVPKGCRHPNFEKDVVYLFQDARTPTIPSISPTCLKVETWLRLTGIKYEVSFRWTRKRTLNSTSMRAFFPETTNV